MVGFMPLYWRLIALIVSQRICNLLFLLLNLYEPRYNYVLILIGVVVFPREGSFCRNRTRQIHFRKVALQLILFLFLYQIIFSSFGVRYLFSLWLQYLQIQGKEFLIFKILVYAKIMRQSQTKDGISLHGYH